MKVVRECLPEDLTSALRQMMSKKGPHEGMWKERNSKCGAPEKGIWSNRKRCMVLKHSEQQGEWRNMWSEKNHVKSLESGKEFMFILTVRIQ